MTIYTGGQRSSRNPKVRTYQRTRSTTYGTLTITMDPANSAARLIVSLDGEPVETPWPNSGAVQNDFAVAFRLIGEWLKKGGN